MKEDAVAASATLNVRLPETLKTRGNAVLEKEGLSVSDAVRSLYEYMEREQEFPDVLRAHPAEDLFARRRELMRSMIGILPADITLDEAREARFARKGM